MVLLFRRLLRKLPAALDTANILWLWQTRCYFLAIYSQIGQERSYSLEIELFHCLNCLVSLKDSSDMML